jgi:hypothetical protein
MFERFVTPSDDVELSQQPRWNSGVGHDDERSEHRFRVDLFAFPAAVLLHKVDGRQQLFELVFSEDLLYFGRCTRLRSLNLVPLRLSPRD